MPFDFDRVIDRRGFHATKLESMQAACGVAPEGALSMWVADMDFAAPEPVRRRLGELVEHGVFGYYGGDAGWRRAACAWSAGRHGWEVEPDWITPSPGICAALALIAQAFAAPGEGVVVFPPVYHAFYRMIRAAGRRPVEAPLRQRQGRWAMDLEALGRDLPQDARIVFLCSPHNPGGTVWSREELAALAAFCAERDLILVSDEVWRDLVLDGPAHVPTALAAPDAAPRLITCVAASKTFNLAGGATAEIIIADPALRARYREAAEAAHATSTNLFGMIASEAAYAEGAPWLDALRPYLAANRDRFASAVAEAAPGARVMRGPATYLAWADFSGTGLPPSEVDRRVRERARIAANPGPSFGAGGQTCLRFNFGCPRSVVDAAAARLADAFDDLRRR
jgi:cystathionine beta-lyase